jgi:sec-independent protein translocase protein TatB
VFDVGAGEIVGLAVVALVVVGPDKLPRYAADAARMLRRVRRMASEARDEVTRELGPELKDLDLADLDPRQLVRPTGSESADSAPGYDEDVT